MPPDALHEGGEVGFVELCAGLVRIPRDPRDGDLGARRAAGPLRDQRGKAAAEAAVLRFSSRSMPALRGGALDVSGARLGAHATAPLAALIVPAARRARNSAASRRYASAPRDAGL